MGTSYERRQAAGQVGPRAQCRPRGCERPAARDDGGAQDVDKGGQVAEDDVQDLAVGEGNGGCGCGSGAGLARLGAFVERGFSLLLRSNATHDISQVFQCDFFPHESI